MTYSNVQKCEREKRSSAVGYIHSPAIFAVTIASIHTRKSASVRRGAFVQQKPARAQGFGGWETGREIKNKEQGTRNDEGEREVKSEEQGVKSKEGRDSRGETRRERHEGRDRRERQEGGVLLR